MKRQRIQLSVSKVCERCKGKGRVPDHEEPEASEDGMMPFPTCEGEGIIPLDMKKQS